nr:hypothetical protein [Tanacetum cinerariifolium]
MKDDPYLQKDDVFIWLALKIKFEILQVATTCRPFTVRLRDQEDPYDDAHLEGENSAKRQKTSDYFPDDDIEERTFRWVEKFVKRFNPYAGYEVKHWKNPHAKIFYIKKQQVPRKPKEEIYSKSKIVQIIKTYWELGHEHKFITEIVARRENGSIGSITEVDDYAETRLLWSLSVFMRNTVIWERVYFQLGVESYQQQVNLTAPTITFLGIKKYKMFSIISEQVYHIYKNNKKEKRVMRHKEVHKFCDATLKRVLEGLKSYNNDVKYGYVTHNLSKEDVEYLQLFAKEIEK